MKGNIKVLKGWFGFITVDGQDDIFFHANNLEWVDFDSLSEGDMLEFDMGEGRNGKEQAVNITLVQ